MSVGKQGSGIMVTRTTTTARTARGRRLLTIFLFASSLLPSLGCASFWDDVTSRDFHVKELFVKPHPLDVLAQSKDGDRRARALAALREPKAYGGTDQDQDYVLKLVIDAAVSERQPLCRLAAIQTLGRFKDPRAVQGLIDAYYAVTEQRSDPTANNGLATLSSKQSNYVNTFTPEMIARIQSQVVTALGETGSPLAVELLTTVVREPSPEGQNKQQAMDVRIAATRALARYPHYQATETLVHVLKTEKDIALRDAAHESLQTATGKKLPPDGKAWEQFLHDSSNGNPPADRGGFLKSVGFFNPLAPRNE